MKEVYRSTKRKKDPQILNDLQVSVARYALPFSFLLVVYHNFLINLFNLVNSKLASFHVLLTINPCNCSFYNDYQIKSLFFIRPSGQFCTTFLSRATNYTDVYTIFIITLCLFRQIVRPLAIFMCM